MPDATDEVTTIVDPRWRADVPIEVPSTEYFGGARVVVVPPGVSGDELAPARAAVLSPGSLWRRGRQKVRVVSIIRAPRKRMGEPLVKVEFRELSYGSRLRQMSAPVFLRSSQPLAEISEPAVEGDA
jgi:hypothetical protein